MTATVKIGSRLYLTRAALGRPDPGPAQAGLFGAGAATGGRDHLVAADRVGRATSHGLVGRAGWRFVPRGGGRARADVSVRRRAGRAQAVPVSGATCGCSSSTSRRTTSYWMSVRRRCPSWRCWACGRANWRPSRSRTACSAWTIRELFRCESEPWYTQIRQEALLIAVNCTRPSGTCFCTAWGTGPEATKGFDLALTELRDGFLVHVGSKRGATLVEELPVREPTLAEVELAAIKLERARDRMGRQLDTTGLKELLDQSIEYPEWDEIAHRCLSCGNCTMVCPTCFCCTVSDTTNLAATQEVARTRQWESCFTHQFTYTISGPERNTIRGRYRHWLRHKLGTWWEQFGCSGCVGCGRCITWCPVGIDLTEEVRRLRARSLAHGARGPALRKGEVDHGPARR